jgi:hypothetical protein
MARALDQVHAAITVLPSPVWSMILCSLQLFLLVALGFFLGKIR